MATTTNYAWDTPDDTDLVKDGAAAIRTLGSSIDTTTKNLNPQTTTGALAFRSATSNVNTALPIGTAGQVLTVNSGATAPEWAAPAAGGSETLLSTTSLSGTATTISGISGAYKHLRIWMSEIDITTATAAQIRWNFNSDLGNHYSGVSTAIVGTILDKTNDIAYATGDRTHSTSASETSLIIDVYHYSNTDTYKPYTGNGIYLDSAASAYTATTFFGGYASTSAITSIRFFSSSAQAFTGTVKIYGVN